MTSSLLSKSELNPVIFFSNFLAKRIRRILPALIVCVVVTSLIICLVNPDPEQEITTGIASLFGFSNIYLTQQATDYFATSSELNPFTQTWFLGALIQSELFLCLIAWISLWITTRIRHTYWDKRRIFTWIISIVILISFLRFIYLYPIDRSSTYFSAATRFWEIGLGSLAYLLISHVTTTGGIYQYSRDFLYKYIISQATCLVLLIAITSFFFLPLAFAVQGTVLTALATSAVLVHITQTRTKKTSLLSRKEIIFLGSISYSLYLWHWSVLSISRWTTGIYWWLIPVQLGIILFFAWLSFQYIELPSRQLKWPGHDWKVAFYGILTSVIIAGFLFSLTKVPALSLYSGRHPELIAKGVQSLTEPYSIDGAEGEWRGIDCVISGEIDIDKKIDVEKCTLGSLEDSKARVLVAGNSFSASFTHAFDELIREDEYSVIITSSWGSSVLPSRFQGSSRKNTDDYSDHYWSLIIFDIIPILKPNDWVFLVNDMAGLSPPVRTSDNDVYFQEFRNNLIEFSRLIESKDLNLAILHGNPFAREANCKPNVAIRQWFHPFGTPCKLPGKTASLQRRQELDDFLRSLEQEGKISVVDLFDIFCPGRICTYNAANGDLLYRDEYSHPSVEAARLSAPIIRQALTSGE
ncbi:acyltransferase 3 [Leptolyngbya sp. BL0902]|uniref:acyltransferase family protein n=1 Tax=Leptolyngbya sp. BL0902 TaxID=1115757 RepID=UPI0018E7AF38|nr:acyltransferase family protein [Leptolyngbya sp. BL0902]QQE64857.1 acyltransferase 3 [Leptolyngbya sp. BL0902]